MAFFYDPCFYVTVQKFRLLDCHTVTRNSPLHDIKRPDKYLFSRKFISSLTRIFTSNYSGRWLKKLNVLIEFSNSIFIKFYFKADWHWTWIQVFLQSFFCFKLFICLSALKRPKFFRGFTPQTPTSALPWNCWPRDPNLHFTTIKNLIFVPKWTLVKLLG